MGYVNAATNRGHGDEVHHLFEPDLVAETMLDMAAAGGDALLKYAKEFTPISENPFSQPGRKPGTLRERWRKVEDLFPGIYRGSPSLTVRIENWDPIAPFVENDTRPHIIKPRADRAPASVIATKKPRRMGDDPQASLAFRAWPSGVMIFARIVKHPGTTGHHMTLKAAGRVEAAFGHLMDPAVNKWAKRQERSARRANGL